MSITHVHYVLLALLLTTPTAECYQQIPEDLLKYLRNSSTIHELLDKMNTPLARIFDSMSEISESAGLNAAPTTAPVKVKIAGFASYGRSSKHNRMSTFSSSRRGPPPPDARMATVYLAPGEVETIDEPKQSRDSCIIHPVCAPIPIQREPNILYFPECIDLDQCLGGCCDTSTTCGPTETYPVNVKITAWKYKGQVNGKPKFEIHNSTYIPMKRHAKCKCASCIHKPICNEEQRLNDKCKCECKDRKRMEQCKGNGRTWSDEKCQCLCEPRPCDNDQLFSIEKCECESADNIVPIRKARHISGVYLTKDEYYSQNRDAT
uniref:Platelet-derived growth factor (PDGF) family profile domain-containing protein n=1 Tax=Romanomermis culicivorax TaxID=13658 RepID=A0A915JNI7_ROMCU